MHAWALEVDLESDVRKTPAELRAWVLKYKARRNLWTDLKGAGRDRPRNR